MAALANQTSRSYRPEPSAHLTIVPGTRLGTYEVVAPMGAGGMGEVYSRARHQTWTKCRAPGPFASDPKRLPPATTSAITESPEAKLRFNSLVLDRRRHA
jgi:hypothetical protein